MRLKAKLAREWGIKTFPNAGNSEEYIAMEAFVAGFEMAREMAIEISDDEGCINLDRIGEEDVDET